MSHPSAIGSLVEHAVLSDVGLRRPNNQDSSAVVLAGSDEEFRSRGHMFIVADGMGGHAAGELASKLACTGLTHIYRKLLDRTPVDAIRQAFAETNASIFARGQANAEFQGMGTTCCVLLLLPEGAVTAHVGDSRIYRLRGTMLEQITFDHSVVWEMKAAGHLGGGEVPSFLPKNQITRSLGPHPEVQVDLEGPFPLEAGDTFLLCSDGLTGQVKDEELGVILGALAPHEAARTLVDLANLRGGPDNITAIVVRMVRPLSAAEGSADADPGAGKSIGLGGVPAALWVVSGLCAVVAVAMIVAGKLVPAALSGLGALVAGAIGVWYGLMGRREPLARQSATHLLGKGPHVARHCVAEEQGVARLAGVADQLRSTAAEQNWQIDLNPFNRFVDEAQKAASKKQYLEAVRNYGLAISYLMDQIRSQRTRPIAGEQPAMRR